MLKTLLVPYHDEDVELEGYLAYDETIPGKKPAVLVVHDWSGRNKFACEKAEALAKSGYVGFAIDVYGKGKIVSNKEEKQKVMKPFLDHREKLLQRLRAALAVIRQQPQVDTDRIASIGFCFGGLCSLDLVRAGEPLKGVVAFHAQLTPPNLPPAKITAKVLVLHGEKDKMVPREQVLAFQDEMMKANADWQMNIYGNAQHSFTNPLVNDPVLGFVYDACAAERSWVAMQGFLKEVLQ